VVFALIFGSLAIYHLRQSANQSPRVEITKRLGAGQGSVQIFGTDIDKPLQDFAQNFNAYVHNQDETSRNQNLAAFAGYLAAFFTAIFSAFLEFLPREKATRTEENSHSDSAD
jgi:hypothetical protein